MALFAQGWIDTGTLADQLQGPSPPAVIDVRNPDEFTGPLGHIETATNIPLPVFAQHAAALLADPSPKVMVCHTDRRSSAAADYLRKQGATNVTVLQGGMMAWSRR
jgi:hypothetical protein